MFLSVFFTFFSRFLVFLIFLSIFLRFITPVRFMVIYWIYDFGVDLWKIINRDFRIIIYYFIFEEYGFYTFSHLHCLAHVCGQHLHFLPTVRFNPVEEFQLRLQNVQFQLVQFQLVLHCLLHASSQHLCCFTIL